MNSRVKTYDIKVRDSIFSPNKKGGNKELIAHYKKNTSRSSKTLYKVYLFIEGKDLPFIKKVKYTLHKTFRNPVKTIERKSDNTNCSLVIWTWGLFNIKVELEDINGEIIHMNHYLNYGSEVKTKGVNWISTT
ncbi:pYEATS domain-containing protein [uncultured Tenacibaculum sp.]|uniref:pYEATS domain-containing protein n=1 Tax=uncultured Tenacibaculum sp. TaxID=174713 RepID=UPI00262EF846|nr:pYEATS domain-containing protein [uncultured Tenacibaculum sp.]